MIDNDILLIRAGMSNIYLIPNKDRSILVDTGRRNHASEILNNIKKFGLKPSDIALIILSHSHFDHSGNLKELKKLTGSKIMVHEKEAKNLKSGYTIIPKGTVNFTKGISWFGRNVFRFIGKYPAVTPDIIINDHFDLSEWNIEGYVFPTPGHTEGSVSVIVGKNAIVGDNLINVVYDRIFPVFANDVPELLRSWQKLLDTGCINFYPGHGRMIKRQSLENNLEIRKKKI